MGGLIQDQIIEKLQHSRHLMIFTGAGVSAESGIPTFREAQTGLWARFEPGELATPAAFRRDPALVWGWYEWRRLQVLRAHPNPAHIAIAELAKRVPKLSVITQNVDDLHERAGSTEVIHLHGSLHEPRCFACGRSYIGGVADLTDQSGSERLEPPRCERCNGRVRPGVVWFGEPLPEQSMRAALVAARDCDCLLSIGTSGVVMPVARIPEMALENGAAVIHINVQSMDVSAPGEFSLVGRAGELLPTLLQQAFSIS